MSDETQRQFVPGEIERLTYQAIEELGAIPETEEPGTYIIQSENNLTIFAYMQGIPALSITIAYKLDQGRTKCDVVNELNEKSMYGFHIVTDTTYQYRYTLWITDEAPDKSTLLNILSVMIVNAEAGYKEVIL